MNQYNEDPLKTELFIVTHVHIDHFNDLCAIIEASRESLHDKNYHYFKKGTLITTTDTLKYISDYHQNMLEKIVPFKAGDSLEYKDVQIVGTKVIHSKVEGFGVIFKLKDYTIAFSSDTRVFEGFSEQFSGVDILVLNLLRPDSIVCRRHLCTDEVIPYLNDIKASLKGLVITHFGSYMDSTYSLKNFIPSQIEKFKMKTDIKRIIAAEVGLKIKIAKILYSS